MGFVATSNDLVAQIVERKVLSTLTGSSLLEAFVSEVLGSGRYRRHVQQVRARLTRMRTDSLRALQSAGIDFTSAAGEGIFLWGRLPEPANLDVLVSKAREKSILLAKGSLFSPTGEPSQWMRFNAAYGTAPELVHYLSQSLKTAA